ncbi:hypothetical protein ACLOJK_029174 [Asimina triloba]
MLETQIAQQAAESSNRNYGKLPSRPETNPKEQIQAISLRRGKQVENPGRRMELEKAVILPNEESTSAPEEIQKEKSYVPPPPYQPPLPFPQRVQNAKMEKHFGRLRDNDTYWRMQCYITKQGATQIKGSR